VSADALATGWDVALRGGEAGASRATELDAFVGLIRDEERRLPRRERLNTTLMITRLRKLFYGGRGWDEHLIPGAAEVAPLYPFVTTDHVRRSVEAPGRTSWPSSTHPRVWTAPGRSSSGRASCRRSGWRTARSSTSGTCSLGSTR